MKISYKTIACAKDACEMIVNILFSLWLVFGAFCCMAFGLGMMGIHGELLLRWFAFGLGLACMWILTLSWD